MTPHPKYATAQVPSVFKNIWISVNCHHVSLVSNKHFGIKILFSVSIRDGSIRYRFHRLQLRTHVINFRSRLQLFENGVIDYDLFYRLRLQSRPSLVGNTRVPSADSSLLFEDSNSDMDSGSHSLKLIGLGLVIANCKSISRLVCQF